MEFCVDISIVVPLYNEEENVRLLYEEIAGVLDTMTCQSEIVFADDGSRDKTLEILEAIQQQDPRVRAVSLRRNFGQTAAMTAGSDRWQAAIDSTAIARSPRPRYCSITWWKRRWLPPRQP